MKCIEYDFESGVIRSVFLSMGQLGRRDTCVMCSDAVGADVSAHPANYLVLSDRRFVNTCKKSFIGPLPPVRFL